MDDWSQRDRVAMTFWREYVAAARTGYGSEFDHSDEMRVAINEWFAKIDEAVGEANATGCVFFKCTSSRREPQKVKLLFSDGKGRTFRRTLKIDDRFRRPGTPPDFHDFSNLKIAVQSMILNEGKVRLDPKGGWFAPL